MGTGLAKAPAGVSTVEPEGPTWLRVKNRHFHDVRVYVVRSGTRHLLGTVGSFEERRLRVPRPLVAATGGVAFEAWARATGEGFLSPQVLVERGRTVELEVAGNLALSAVSVRP